MIPETGKVLRPFLEAQEFMKERVNSGIEQYRKGSAKLRFTDMEGRCAENVHVEIRQKTHDFRFGANCFMLGELENGEKNEEYKKLFANLFNLATVPFYWNHLEVEQGKPRFAADSPKVYRRPAPDLCVDFCLKNGIEPKLHCLNYDQWTPLWLPVDADAQTVKRFMQKRIAEIAERYGAVIPGMEVTNETLWKKIPEEKMQFEQRHSTHFFEEPDLVEWSFHEARKVLPSTKLIINDGTRMTWGEYHWNRSRYYMQIERALEAGTPIDSIGFQFHLFVPPEQLADRTGKWCDPRFQYEFLDRYADFRKPMQITEITFPAYSLQAEDEDLQAELLKNMYHIWFSHPNMEAIIYWNLVDGYAYVPDGDKQANENQYYAGLIRHDMSRKPAYQVLDDLIHHEWHTELELTGKSEVDFRGFYGEYEGTAVVNGRTVPIAFHLSQHGENRFDFKLNENGTI